MLWGSGGLGVLSRQTVAGGVGGSQGSPARPGKGTGPSLNPPPPPGPLRAQRDPGPSAPGSVRCGPGGKLGWGSWGLSHLHKPPQKKAVSGQRAGDTPDMSRHEPTCGAAPGGGMGGCMPLGGAGHSCAHMSSVLVGVPGR